MSGSKTKYYVASSLSPIFDGENRINQFEAAMLDYTANSPIEMSEYMKQYFNSSRLRGYRGWLNYWKTHKYTDEFGSITSSFYGDADINNERAAEGLKQILNPPSNKELFVYRTVLNYFSEDFWIKYLATQQGHADWVYQEYDLDYEVEYPTANTIKAVFEDGRVIEGSLPSYTAATRFLELSYSYIVTITEETEVPPIEPDGETSVITTTTYRYEYGYYHYKEGDGNSILDSLIQNNGITAEYSFFPVLPLRTNTAWYSGTKSDLINEALDYLTIMGEKDPEESYYDKLKTACTDGMKEGNIGDIDYITLILGVSINSTHQSDLKYLYNFFLNLHVNFSIANGLDPSEAWQYKNLYGGYGVIQQWHSCASKRARDYRDSDEFYYQFSINNASSNLNYIYRWGGSDYAEANGKFKPDAKIGEYGVLSGEFSYSWQEQVPATDSEGNIIVRHDEDGTHVVYETVTYTQIYSITLFCRQYSETRWRFVAFIDLNLKNLIYAEKSIRTDAYDAICDAESLGSVTHDFSMDFPETVPNDIARQYTFKYVDAVGDPTTAFVVPLEWNTFMEIGTRDQLEVSYGSQFLIFNCWVKKKIKWYQQGFFSIFFSFVGVVISGGLIPILPTIGIVGLTFFGTVLVMAAAAVMAEITLKILTGIFGQQIGTFLYNLVPTILNFVIRYVSAIPVVGWIAAVIAAAISFAWASGNALNNGATLWEAFLQGSTSAIVSGGSQIVSNSPIAGSVAVGVGNTISGLIQGDSFGEALLSGVFSGVFSGISQNFQQIADFFDIPLLEDSTNVSTVELQQQAQNSLLETFWNDFLLSKVIQNPFTYVQLLGMSAQEATYHKLANLEGDFQEFNNAAQSAQSVLNILLAQQDSVITAEFVCKLQTNVGRALSLFPSMLGDMSPDSFYTMALNCDIPTSVTSSISTFVENKLTLSGYSPEILYYTQTNFGIEV